MKRILFVGDSITDGWRERDNDNLRGSGYVTAASAWVSSEFPGEYQCINRGIGGNRIVDLLAREKCDIINLKPDYVSIMIGVNDVWQELGLKNGISPERYEVLYDMLISDIKTALPDAKMFIMGSYLTKGLETTEKWDEFKGGVDKMAAVAKKLAEKHGLLFVDMQKAFDEALTKAPAEYWTVDGVHPTSGGQGLIAREWIKAFMKIKNAE